MTYIMHTHHMKAVPSYSNFHLKIIRKCVENQYQKSCQFFLPPRLVLMAFWQPKIGPKSSQNHKKSSWHLKNVTVPYFLSARRFQMPTKRLREASKKLQSTSDRRPGALQKPQNDLLKPPKAPFPVNKSGPEAVNTLQMIAKDFVTEMTMDMPQTL